MALISGNIIGLIHGKLGEAVAYQLNGKYVLRSLPSKSRKNKKGTAAQQVSRSRFTKMQFFLGPILPFIRVGFNMEGRAKQMTAHNAAKSYNMRNAINEQGEIDYSKVRVCYGRLAGAEEPAFTKDGDLLHFTWTYNMKSQGWSDDQVMVLVYNPEEDSRVMILSGAKRKKGQETLKMTGLAKGCVHHVWIAFISDDRQEISMSTYLGEVSC